RRSHLVGARPGPAVARHDRRSRHAPACPGRLARCGVVGAAARGPRAHALRRPGPEAAARSGDGWRARSPRHGPARPRPVDPGAGGVRRVRELIHVSDQGILIYFLALNSFYAVLMILSIPEIWEQTRLADDDDFQRIMQSDALPPITLLVPAYNESATVVASVTALLTLEYRNFEVIVVNDGSRDDTLDRLTRPFLLGRHIAAVGGTVRVANSCTVAHGCVTDARVPRRFLPGVQVVEYLRAFLFGRLGWNRLGGNLIISGAFGLFRKDYLLAIGGYRTESVVEDMDVVVRLHRHLLRHRIPYEMPFIPDPVAWTEVPESGRFLARQRERWHRGLLAAMWQYKGMLFNPRYGRVGLIGVPFYTFGEALAPLVEVLGYVITVVGFALGIVNVQFALLFVLVAWGYGMLLSIWAVVLEEVSFRRYGRGGDLARLLLFATLENLGYRQRTVWWRLKAFFTVWQQRQVWGEMTRKG